MSSQGNRSSLRVLLIDDEPELLEMAKHFLSKAGEFDLEVSTTPSGLVERANANEIDVVVCDYQIGEKNGIEVLKELRASGSDLPFILFTGKGREEVVIEAIDNGADFYLQKGGAAVPQFAELSMKIKAAVDGMEQRRDLQRYRTIVRCSVNEIYLIDIETLRFNFVNEAGLKNLGYSMEEMLRLTPLDLKDDKDEKTFRKKLEPLVDGTVPSLIFDSQHIRKDGSRYYVEVRLQVATEGSKRQFMAIVMDITDRNAVLEALRSEIEERKEAEGNLAKLTKLLEDTQALSRVGGWEYDVTASKVTWTKEVYRIHGVDESYDPSQAKQNLEFYSPESAMVLRNAFRDAQSGIPYDLELEMVRRNGEHIWVRTKGNPVMSDGKMVKLSGTISDITEIVMMERMYKNETSKLRTLIGTMPGFVYLKDLEGSYIMMNRNFAQAVGVPRKELLGKKAKDILPPEQASKIFEEDQRLISGEVELVISEVEFPNSGRRLMAEMTKKSVRNCYGEITGIVGVGVDITELKMTELALKQANKKLNLLSSITRHDIMNAVMRLAGMVDIYWGESEPENAERIQSIIRELGRRIEFTREYEGVGVSQPIWQSLDKVWDLAANALDLSTLDVEATLSGMEIYADPMLEKVFYNLLENSIRHGGQGMRSIRCHYAKAGSGIVIIYSDDGAGVPTKDKKKIFGRGFGSNTGLGLFLTKEILDLTGIGIIETGEEGKGARFELTVPEGCYMTSEESGKLHDGDANEPLR